MVDFMANPIKMRMTRGTPILGSLHLDANIIARPGPGAYSSPIGPGCWAASVRRTAGRRFLDTI